MDVETIEEKKSKLHLALHGETHTFSNLLREQLWKQDGVKIAAYRIKHPLLGNPELLVETTTSEAKEAVIKAAEELKGQNKEFLKAFKKIVK